jgi:hypothetical protein
MSLEALGSLIAKSAPLLGGALAGPAGAALGAVIAAKFGGSINDTSDLINRVEGDPNAKLKLLEIQSNNEVELQHIHMMIAENELKFAYLEIESEYQDRNSAREREAALAQAGQRDYTPAVLAYLLTLGVFITMYSLFTQGVPNDNKELIVSIMSAVTTVWIAAMAYYHGSSAGSRSKDRLLLNTETSQHLNQSQPPSVARTKGLPSAL